MSAQIIDGKQIALDVRAGVAEKVAALKAKGIVPCLAVVLVGENPASVSYVTGKRKALAEAGMADKSVELPENTTEEDLLKLIDELNKDDSVHGILVQLPLPKHINEDKVIMAISPEKDVDGFHPVNVGNLVIGRSNIVGKPVSLLLARKETNCTVTICHTGTKNMAEITRQADILIAASGHPHTVTADMVKDGAVIIDVGVNRIPDSTKKSGFRLIGDCDFDDLKEKASYITPVPGGVGPMTIAMLMYNTLEAAENKANA